MDIGSAKRGEANEYAGPQIRGPAKWPNIGYRLLAKSDLFAIPVYLRNKIGTR